MPNDVQTLAQRVRAKYPDAYTDISDEELEAKVRAKYPGVYDDVPLTTQKASIPEGESTLTAGNLLRGVEKSAVGAFTGLGELVHQIPGVTTAVDALYGTPGLSKQAFTEANQSTTAQNTGEAVGKFAGDVGQMFVPVEGMAGKLAKVPEIVKSAVLGASQSEGSPEAGIASGVITAAIPGGKTIGKVAGLIRESAEASMARALGATKEKLKDEAAKLAPQMLERGIGGTRRGMRELAKRSAEIVGNQLDAAYDAAEKAGQSVPSLVIQGNLQLAGDAFKVKNAAGKMVPIPGYEGVIQKMDELGDFAASLGPDIPVKHARIIRQKWDEIVDDAGLFQKIGANPAQKSTAASLKTAADSFRDLLNQNPTIADLNKESAFWSGMNKVLKATKKRTQAQTGGLFGAMGMSTGAVAGGLSGDSYTDRAKNAALGAIMGRGMVKLLTSPYWQSKVSAPLKDKLAEALASGSAGSIASASSRIMAALPPQLRVQFQ